MLFLGWWDQTSRTTVFWGDLTPVRSLVDESDSVEATADQSHVPLRLRVPLSHSHQMASDKAPAIISFHTPSSSLALVHSGVIVYLSQVLHTSPSHPFASYDRIHNVTLRQAQ
jgi:hypothetical protein